MPDPRVIRERYCATAPGYDELYREEQLEKYRLVFTRVSPRGVIADIGAGTCLLEEFLARERLLDKVGYIVALDLTDCMLRLCKDRIRRIRLSHLTDIVVGEATRLPLRDHSIDYSFAFTVYDLTEDARRAVDEMVRVTRVIGVYTLLKRVEKRRLTTECQVYIGETDKDVACLPRALRDNYLDARVVQ